MLKKDITYENLDGEMVTKTFYFNLRKDELIKMEMENANGGGFEESMRRIVASNDGKAIMEEFEKIILATVGERDGDDFIKTPEYAQRFKNSGAYGELFIELVTNAEAGAAFINAVIPAHLAEKVRNMPRPGQPQDYQQKAVDAPAPIQERNVFDQAPDAAPIQIDTPPAPEPTQWGSAGAQQGGIEQVQDGVTFQAPIDQPTRRDIRDQYRVDPQ